MSHCLLLGATLLVVIAATRLSRPRGRKESDGFVQGCSDARYVADRRSPEWRWFHGVFDLYNGAGGDPDYWEQEEAFRHFYIGWQVEDADDAFELIEAYQDSRVKLAFDKVRLIIAAGWLSDAESRRICEEAKRELQATFEGWEELACSIQEGRAQWHGGETPAVRQRMDRGFLAFARDHVFHRLSFHEGISAHVTQPIC